jgi:hypothetical protein
MPLPSEIRLLVGAGLPAKNVNDNTCLLAYRLVLDCFARKPAPAMGLQAYWLDERNLRFFRRKTSNPGEHLVQSQPL